ncbi:MAG: DNA methyltransferase [Candidatus Marinimicrobia bacterium]|nr:DNA methyltransferase [Candidatus Neomarinimicrobiota bacterium]
MKELLEQYLKNLTYTAQRGDAREESYYKHLDELIKQYADIQNIKKVDVTILPKKTEAGNPDFRIWDGKNHITGYIEAKAPSISNLDYIEGTQQLKRYLSTFPNVILTNFYEFRLYRDGQRIAQTMIGRQVIAQKLKTIPPVENIDKFKELFDLFFSFSLPKVQTARSLAVELAKRTRFLRDEVIAVEIQEDHSKGHKQIIGFYEAFKKYLIGTLTETQFADLYAQTITYGLFAARTRVPADRDDFNRRVAFDYIPHTIGILRDVFRFISLEEPPKSLQIIVEDIAEILNVADVNKILHEYHRTGKGRDPIIHFYETFLTTYDPKIRERRGVYYTPEPVVGYIVRAIHSILKTHFDLPDGLACQDVKLLDPAGGTLTFPAEAIRLAAAEFREKYGEGGLHQWIKKHIIENFYAFELMMAPYAIGHLKMGFIFDELGYKMDDDERFKLYLTNTLEMEEIEQIAIPGLSSLSEESHLAGKVKKEQPILVILGNPPYSGISANINEWTERLLKEDIDGVQSYYKVDGQPLGEKKLWLQDDYVKFLRFAQWKIHTSGYGIVGMITNHSYLDNPTFRGMRQSLMKTFDEIYILDLHGNSLKKETTPKGGKDENVFDIRQGVAIALFIRNKKVKGPKVYHLDKYGLREEKYKWLDKNDFKFKNYDKIKPASPWYFFIPRNTSHIQQYLKWKRIDEIFPVNVTGIVTARDNLAIDFDKNSLRNKIMMFRSKNLPDEVVRNGLNLKDNYQWKLTEQRKIFNKVDDWEKYFSTILYRPFDIRHIYYQDNIVFRTRHNIMRNMLEKNIALIMPKRVETKIPWQHCLCGEGIIEHVAVSLKTIDYVFPLYLYPEVTKKANPRHGSTIMMLFEPKKTYGKKPNISPIIFEKLETVYQKKPSPEDILYYIYGVFYSNIYRETYAEFLKIDFPRVPFTADFKLFKTICNLGKDLVDLHLHKSPALDPPVARYQGSSNNDRIEQIIYKEDEQRIYINEDKYFEGIAPEVWNYHIGGYQVLHKYLKDRKGQIMDDAPHYCRIVTALSKTINIQKKIDQIYPEIERDLLHFDK